MDIIKAFVLDIVSRNFPHLHQKFRVNFLRGRVDLHDVDLPESECFLLSSHPFKLDSGTIGSLTLQFPWTQLSSSPARISAERVSLNFSEMALSTFSSIFHAIERDSRQRKFRLLAEHDLPDTPVIRAFKKLLPLLLQRVELNVRELQISVKFSDGCVIYIKLGALDTHAPSSRADLAKTLIVSSLNIEVKRQSNVLFSLDFSRIEVKLTIASGQFDIHLSIPGVVPLNIDVSFLQFVRDLKTRHGFIWFAFRSKRPTQSVSANSSAWFRYALNVVCRSLPVTRTITEAGAQQFARDCVEYEHLHLLRLRDRLRINLISRITHLEDIFDAEMILLLRAQAAKHALAEQASEFASRSWLSWTLFRHSMSPEREQMMTEIRKSLGVLGDEPESNSVQGDASARLRLTAMFTGLRTSLCGVGEDLIICISELACQSEVDLSLESFSAVMSVRNINILNGGYCIMRSGYPGTGLSDVSDVFLELKVLNSVLDDEISVTTSIQPFWIVVDVSSVSKFVSVLSMTMSERSDFVTGVIDESFDIDAQHSPVSRGVGPLDINISLPRFRVVVVDEMPKSESSACSHGIAISIKDFSALVQHRHQSRRIEAHLGIRVESCVMGSFSKNESIRTITTPPNVLTNEVLVFTALLDFSTEQQSRKMAIRNLEGALHTTEAQVVVEALQSMYLKVRSLQQLDPEPCSSISPRNKIVTHSVSVPSFRLRFYQGKGNIQNGSFFGVEVEGISSLAMLSDGQSSMSVEKLNMHSIRHEGIITFSPSSSRPNGLEVSICLAPVNSSSSEVEASIGNVSVRTTMEFVREALSTYSSILHLFSFEVSSQASKESADSSIRGATGYRFSAHASSIRIEFVDQLKAVLLLTQAYTVQDGLLLNGSCGKVELIDLSRSSGLFSKAIKCTDNRSSVDQRALSFDMRPGFLRAQVSNLCISILRSFLFRLTKARKTFDQILRVTYFSNESRQTLKKGRDQESIQDPSTSNNPSNFTVRGTDLSVLLPVSAFCLDVVRIDLALLTAVLADNSQVISARRITSMTSSLHATCPSSRSCKDIGDVIGSSDWDVVMRGLDVDLSHHLRLSRELPEQHDYSKDNWAVSVLSRVTAYLAPSQIVTVWRMIESLFFGIVANVPSPSTSTSASNDREPPVSFQDESNIAALAHIFVHCETHALSLELLRENDAGVAHSTLASVDLDPIVFSLRSILKRRGIDVLSAVTTWKAVCPSFRVEDGDVNTPAYRSVIIETEESWIGMRASSQSLDGSDVNMGLNVEGIIRYDEENGTTSSHEIQVRHARVVASMKFFPAIGDFITQSIPTYRRLPEGRTAAYSSTSDPRHLLPNNAAPPPQFKDGCTAKLSVRLIEPVVSLHKLKEESDDPHVELRGRSLKVSILFSRLNNILEGSILRGRDLKVVLVRLPNPRAFENCSGQQRKKEPQDAVGFNLRDQVDTPSFPAFLGHLANANRQNSQFLLPRQDGAELDVESILVLESLVVRPPTEGRDALLVSIPTAVVDASVRGLHAAKKVVPFLEVFQPSGHASPANFPELRFVINSLSGRVKIATSSLSVLPDLFRRNFVVLRLRLTTEVHISQDVEALQGYVKLSADVVDEHINVCDNMISPTAINFEFSVREGMSFHISTERFIRLTLSPLTARALTGLSFLLSDRDLNSKSDSQGQLLPYLQGRVTLKGIILYCVAQEPRVQLLRVVLRDITIAGHIPLSPQQLAIVEFTLHEFTVEDTVPWSLFWREGERKDSMQWSNVVVGFRTPRNDGPNTSMFPTLRLIPFFQISTLPSHETYTPESPHEWTTNIASERDPRNGDPLLSCVLRWVTPVQDISLEVNLRGLEFNLDMGMLPSILDWLWTISNEVQSVKEANPSAVHSQSTDTMEMGSDTLRIGIDHIVIEPVMIRISARAPPRRLEESPLHRWLGWIVDEETAGAVNFEIPRVIFSGDFPGFGRLLERLASLYTKELFTRRAMQQLVWQAPRFARMAKVFATSALRRRDHVVINRERNSTTLRPFFVRAGSSVGLLCALEDRRLDVSRRTWTAPGGGLLFNRVFNLLDAGHTESSSEMVSTATVNRIWEEAANGLETLDLT